MRLLEAKREYYRRLAKEKGVRSRAFFKLQQVDARFKAIGLGAVVFDFGCAPGGWLQYASRAVGPKGLVLGVDLKPVNPVAPNVKTILADVSSTDLPIRLMEVSKRKADVVLSDLSPSVSGVWDLDHQRQISLTSHIVSNLVHLLQPGGSAVLKVFQGESFEEFVKDLKKVFKDVDIVRPPATRASSSEAYLVCRGFKGDQPP